MHFPSIWWHDVARWLWIIMVEIRPSWPSASFFKARLNCLVYCIPSDYVKLPGVWLRHEEKELSERRFDESQQGQIFPFEKEAGYCSPALSAVLYFAFLLLMIISTIRTRRKSFRRWFVLIINDGSTSEGSYLSFDANRTSCSAEAFANPIFSVEFSFISIRTDKRETLLCLLYCSLLYH